MAHFLKYFSVFGLTLLVIALALLPVSAIEQWCMLAVVVGLLGLLVWQLVDREVRPAISSEGWPVIVLMAALSVLVVLSIVLSEVSYVALSYAGIFAVFPVSFFLVLKLEGRDTGVPVFHGLLFVAGLLSAVTLLQYFVLTPFLDGGRINWPMANPNSLAGFLSFGFFGAYAVFLRRSNWLGWVLSGLLVLLVFAAVAATGSMGAFSALVISVVIMSGLLWSRVRVLVKPLLVLFAGMVLVLMGLEVLVVDAAQNPVSSFVASGGAFEQRFELWKAALAIFTDYPLTGTGIGTFFLYYPEYRLEDYGTAGLMAHNEMLQFAAELGVLGPVLIYMLVAAVGVLGWRVYTIMPEGDARRVYIVAGFCALVACFVHAHITFHFHVLSIMLVAGLVLGLWLSLVMDVFARVGGGAGRVRRVMPDGVRMGFAAALVLGGFLYASFVVSNVYFDKAHVALRRGDFAVATDYLNRADALAQRRNARAIVLAAHMHLTRLEQGGAGMAVSDKQYLIGQIMHLLKRAEAVNPRLASVQFSYAWLAKNVSDLLPPGYKEEAPYLEAALRLNPQHMPARMRLANILREAGDFEGQLRVLEAGLDWPYTKQNPLAYYGMVAQVAEAGGDMDLQARALAHYQRKQARQIEGLRKLSALREWMAEHGLR